MSTETKKPLQNTANFGIIQEWVERVKSNHTRGVTFRVDSSAKGKLSFEVAIITSTDAPRLFRKSTAEDSFVAAAAWAQKELARERAAEEKEAAKALKEYEKAQKRAEIEAAKARVEAAKKQAAKEKAAAEKAKKKSVKKPAHVPGERLQKPARKRS